MENLNKKIVSRFLKEFNIYTKRNLLIFDFKHITKMNLRFFLLDSPLFVKWRFFTYKNIYYPILVIFLNNNNIKESFFNNVKKFPQQDFNELFFHNPNVYIKVSFQWEKTVEGYDYWEKVSLKWEKYIKPIFN